MIVKCVFHFISIFGIVLAMLSLVLYMMGFRKNGIKGDSVAANLHSFTRVGRGTCFSVFQSVGMSIGYRKLMIIGILLMFFDRNVIKNIYLCNLQSAKWALDLDN